MVSTPSPKTDDPVLSARDAAEQLGIAVQTLYNWNAAGTGPERIKYGNGAVRYSQSTIDAYKRERAA